ncbi:L-histidine N(alpha)-methyltransferase [Nocardioides sp. ChNu-153]|uniref:L-histidine N(alpha)-methyltransferase n=1 Tax=unclassified Nocardioides TaxID=2615069 RepID=UPI0024070694|nr:MULTISPECIES: L-histidine N(alpha)-methyltransferase [unclassified Nocardioides]MDF9714943.1 L-histidine N(alpha)-methyltransferase [Nocardioides sp. ChNu-99]MDN7122460.1 L-histidine N(alpha)-methyltransferase [Nocardioides sp. ChNu-153]
MSTATEALAADVRRGLGSRPLRLPPRWLYDDVGSELFDAITRLPEYYPTEAERSILAEHAPAIAAACDAATLVELGSGTSDKTRLLLDALTDSGRSHGPLRGFVPLDVAEATLQDAAVRIADRHPGLEVTPVVGDFTTHLARLPRGPEVGRRVVAFLGSTIGNLYVEERGAFLGALADSLEPGEWLLLGTDLLKPVERLVAAYDDASGVTERFVLNTLRVLNRELDADFDLDAFSYAPLWDPRLGRMDLRVRSDRPQHVRIPGAGLELDLGSGEEIQVEISTKFSREQVAAELAGAGFVVVRAWTDAPGDFALTLARRA